MAQKSGVSLHWGGLDRALNSAVKKGLEHRQALLEAVGESLVSSTVQRFADGKGPDGQTWEPSARAWEDGLAREGRKATAKRKAVRARPESGDFGKTLVDTARLRNSIDYAVTSHSVMVGSNVAYARIHQLGGKAGKGMQTTIPARPYLGVNDTDVEEVKGILADWLAGTFGG